MIVNHGSWTRYTPEQLPDGLPQSIMFCRRDSDGLDWYAVAHDATAWQADSIKMTVMQVGGQMLVQAATRDVQALFPAGATVIELTGATDADPQAAYGGKVYDAASGTFAPPAVPPPELISRRQFFQQAAVQRVITQDEALAAITSFTLPAILANVVNNLPADQQFAAKMLLAGAEFYRSHPVTNSLAAALGWSGAQRDQFWRDASAL